MQRDGKAEAQEKKIPRSWSSKSHQDIAAGDPSKWWWNPIRDFIAGSIAGFAGKVVEYPADSVKVRMQASEIRGISYSGPLHCMREMIRIDGVRSLYFGLPVPLL